MTDDKIREIILSIIKEVDYDSYKYYLPECSEEPDEAERDMQSMISTVRKLVENKN